MSPAGRRPGNVDTRAEIIDAARRVFAQKGYDQASLRGVAREAGVDAALVHHYFDGKPDLFVAAMSIPFDPRAVRTAAGEKDVDSFSGARVIEHFLGMWDRAEGTGSSFATCVSAMASSRQVADAMREFVADRVWLVSKFKDENVDMFWRRRALVSSQLMGLAFTRYILRVRPVSTASPADIGRWAGPTLDRYVMGDID